MGHFILDPLWKHGVCLPKKCSVIVVAKCRQPKKVNEQPCCLVVVFHDECIEFHFGFHFGIIQAEIDEEFLDEQFIVFEPSWLIIWGIQGWLKVVRSRSLEKGHSIVDLDIFQVGCFWLGLEIKLAFKQEPSKFFGVRPIKWVRVLDFHGQGFLLVFGYKINKLAYSLS